MAPSSTAVVTGPQIAAERVETLHPPCGCELHHGIDAALDRLRELVAGGMGQWDASREAFGT